MKTILYDYQEKTANDIFKRINSGEIKGAYLGFDTGCVTGENSVTVKLNGTGPSQVMTMKNLYKRWEKGERFTIKAMVNDRFSFMPIADVIYSGEKECLKITTDKDRIQHGTICHLACTYDHPIFCEKGFKCAEEFKVGDYIFSNGQLVCEYCGKTLKPTIWRKYSKYPNLCTSCAHHATAKEVVEGRYEYLDKDGYVYIVDDTLRNYSEYRDYLKCKEQHNFFRRGIAKHRLEMMKHLGRELTENEVVHHIDHNKCNNNIKNLQLMTQSKHAKLHSHTFSQHLVQNNSNTESYMTKNGKQYYFVPQKAKITDIKPIGVQPVYDVSIADKDIHNFVCSDKIVHNTGKTVTSLSVAEQLFRAGHITGVIVICPVSKVDDWKEDLQKEVPEIETTFVTSFQSAWREKNSKQIQEKLVRCKCLIIVDEGHKMKTYDSKQSKFIQMLSSKFNIKILILSATPQNKKYIDLYPQYKALGSRVFDRPAKDFKKDYCVEAQNWNLVYAGKSRFPFNEIVGYKQIDVMDKEIANYTYYKKYESKYEKPIEIKQVFKMTPEMKYFKEKKVWPRMDEKALETVLMSGDIEDIDTDFIIANRPALHHIYMRESNSGFIKDMFLEKNPKLQWLDDFLDGNEGRLVVFTNFINEAKLVSELCDKKKRHYSIYDGSHKDLTNWNKYEDSIAIVNIQAGSAGLNDFIKTNIAIWFSYPENYIDFVQSKGRLDRIGQTKQPVFYFLEIAGSVEQQVFKALAEGHDFDLRLFEKWLEEGGK